jgi:hypothetical protein
MRGFPFLGSKIDGYIFNSETPQKSSKMGMT